MVIFALGNVQCIRYNAMEMLAPRKTDLASQQVLEYSTDKHVNQEQEGSSEEGTNNDDTLTNFQGFMLLIPTYIGVGFLGLPYMVKLLGLWVGSFGLLLYGFLNEFGALILTGSTHRLTERTGERFGDIGRVAEMSMKLGPPCLQHHAGKFKFCVNCFVLMNYGLLLPDLISIMNLFVRDALNGYLDISDTQSIVAISVLLLPVFLTRRMKLLSRIAIAANIVLLGIVIIFFQYICRDLPDSTTRTASKDFGYMTFTSYTNDVMFSYGGIVLVMPIRDRIKTKAKFDGWNGLLGLGLMIVTSIHVGSGFFGYLKFGEITHVNCILNLPEDNWLYKSLKILSLLTMYCSLGTSVFLVVDITWTKLKDKFARESVQNYAEYIFRVILLVLCCVFTILVPEFQLLMSLNGCFAACSLTLVIPPVIAILTFYGEETPTILCERVERKLTLAFCILVLIFGIYTTIAGTGVAIYMTLNHIVI